MKYLCMCILSLYFLFYCCFSFFFFFRARLVDGTEVIKENCITKPGPTDDVPGRYPKSPPPGHKDIINDVNMCYTSQYLVITASFDGVVKVWK